MVYYQNNKDWYNQLIKFIWSENYTELKDDLFSRKVQTIFLYITFFTKIKKTLNYC